MIQDILIRTLGLSNSSDYKGKTKYNHNCPNCRDENGGEWDNKYNLGVLLEGNGNNVCNCWKCGFRGSVKYLLYKYGSREDYKYYTDNRLDNFSKDEKIKKFFYVRLPKEFIPFNELDLSIEKHKLAYNYVINDRNLNKKTIDFFKIGVCFEGYYKNRVIIPSYGDNGYLNFFVGRSFDGSLPTYLHDNIDKTNFIFNESNINWNHPIYLVEGAMDMVSLPINTIPLLGKLLLSNILKRIVKNKTKVVLILDEGENKAIRDIYNQLQLFNVEVKKIYIKNKDLNKVLKDFGIDGIKEYV